MSEEFVRPPSFPTSVILAIALQVALGILMVFVPFGFDHPGPGELDINYLIYAAMLYVLLLLYGLIVAGLHRKWALAIAQLLVLTILVLLFFARTVAS